MQANMEICQFSEITVLQYPECREHTPPFWTRLPTFEQISNKLLLVECQSHAPLWNPIQTQQRQKLNPVG